MKRGTIRARGVPWRVCLVDRASQWLRVRSPSTRTTPPSALATNATPCARSGPANGVTRVRSTSSSSAAPWPPSFKVKISRSSTVPICASPRRESASAPQPPSSFFPDQFGIGGSDTRSTLILGLVNAAPYFACAVFACWVTDPLARRISSFAACAYLALSESLLRSQGNDSGASSWPWQSCSA
jgi:hypothetical protein